MNNQNEEATPAEYGKEERHYYQPADTHVQQPPIWKVAPATLAIVGINVLIFILMVINGVDFMSPKSQDLISWGANYRPLTMDGQWWRLLSCCFLHIGVIHLAVNMYSFFSVGVILENLMGRTQYLITYILCGIAGSAASLWWHDNTVSAGASGAIFGMFGLFYGWITTSDRLSPEERKRQMGSAGAFVMINLLMGFSGKIDLSAHVGGLVSGLIFGILISKIRSHSSWKAVGIGSVAVIVLTAGLIAATPVTQVGQFQEQMSNLSKIEEKVNALLAQSDESTTPEESLRLLQEGATEWKKTAAICTEIKGYSLPETVRHTADLIVQYCDVRGKQIDLFVKNEQEGGAKYESELGSYQAQLDSIIKSIQADK